METDHLLKEICANMYQYVWDVNLTSCEIKFQDGIAPVTKGHTRFVLLHNKQWGGK